jgi:hypothetical protein
VAGSTAANATLPNPFGTPAVSAVTPRLHFKTA